MLPCFSQAMYSKRIKHAQTFAHLIIIPITIPLVTALLESTDYNKISVSVIFGEICKHFEGLNISEYHMHTKHARILLLVD